MKVNLLWAFFLFVLVSLVKTPSSHADDITLYVQDASRPGYVELYDPLPAPTCILHESCTLRGAIDAANRFLQSPNNSVTILIYSSQINLAEPLVRGRSEDANAEGDLDINFSGANSRLIIMPSERLRETNRKVRIRPLNSANTDRIFDLLSGHVIFDNISIQDGSAALNEGGGGIRVTSGATAHLEASEVKNCKADTGGGILNSHGSLSLNRSSIRNNKAFRHDMIPNDPVPQDYSVVEGIITIPVLEDEYLGAHYLRGGGIANVGGKLEVQSSTIKQNSAGRAGGGISNDQNGTVSLKNSYVMENTARGIAIEFERTVLGTRVYLFPTGSGGGLSNASGGRVRIEHSAIYKNTSMQAGAGISNGLPASRLQFGVAGGTFEITRSIVEQNSKPDRGDFFDVDLFGYTGPGFSNCNGSSIQSLGYNLYVSDSTCPLGPMNDRNSMEANFEEIPRETVAAGVPYYALRSGSLAIDAAAPSDILEDFRGARRPLGAAPDIGPYEKMPPISPQIQKYLLNPIENPVYPEFIQ